MVIGTPGTLTPDQARTQAAALLAKVKLGADPAGERSDGRKADDVRELLALGRSGFQNRPLFADVCGDFRRSPASLSVLVIPQRHSLFVSEVEPTFRLTDVLRSGYSLKSGDHFKPRLRNFSDGPFSGKESSAPD
jgi:hypothetical protein